MVQMKWWKYSLFILPFISCFQKDIPNMDSNEQHQNNTELIATVRTNDQWVFINEQHNLVFPDSFTYADNFSNGWVCVNSGGERIENPEGVLGGEFYLMNINGIHSELFFAEPVHFQNGIAIYRTPNGTFNLMDVDLKIIATGFNSILPFSDGLAAAVRNDTVGFIDEKGEWQLKLSNDLVIDNLYNGLARAKKKDLTGYINQKGEWVINPIFEEAYPFNNTRAIASQKGKYGAIDLTGEWIAEPVYDDMTDFSEDLAGVKLDQSWGFIDLNGQLKIPFKFENARNFNEGYAAVQLDSKVGYINKEGDWVISNRYDAAYDFKNGYAIAMQDGKMGFIDKKGEWIIPPVYERANNFVNPKESNLQIRIN